MLKLSTLETPRFGNWTVLPPEGNTVMFRCQDRKANWYLARNLAVLEDTKTIRLTFQPKGHGFTDDPFFTCDKENECYVCGTKDDLTRHHIVPHKYKKRFPLYALPFGWYDVATLCESCHVACEVFCQAKNKDLEDRYQIVPVKANRGPYAVELGYARTLARHSDKLPDHIWEAFMAVIRPWVEDDSPTQQRLEALVEELRYLSRKKAAQDGIPAQIMAKVEDLDDFAIEWRRDFVGNMRPQHLPEGWDVERRVYEEARNKE